MGVCNCSMFCFSLLYAHSSIAIILMGKRELVTLLNLSFWCLVMAERLFLAVPRGCLRFVIVVFPDHTNLLFLQILDSIWVVIAHTFCMVTTYHTTLSKKKVFVIIDKLKYTRTTSLYCVTDYVCII